MVAIKDRNAMTEMAIKPRRVVKAKGVISRSAELVSRRVRGLSDELSLGRRDSNVRADIFRNALWGSEMDLYQKSGHHDLVGGQRIVDHHATWISAPRME